MDLIRPKIRIPLLYGRKKPLIGLVGLFDREYLNNLVCLQTSITGSMKYLLL